MPLLRARAHSLLRRLAPSRGGSKIPTLAPPLLEPLEGRVLLTGSYPFGNLAACAAQTYFITRVGMTANDAGSAYTNGKFTPPPYVLASSDPAWTGNWVWHDTPGTWVAGGYGSGNLSLSGKGLNPGTAVTRLNYTAFGNYWAMSIYARPDEDLDQPLIAGATWGGTKYGGETPAGVYTRTGAYDDGNPNTNENPAWVELGGSEPKADLVATGLSEAQEDSVGLFVPRNDDRDEGNLRTDGSPASDAEPHDPDGSGSAVAAHRVVAGDDELVPLTLQLSGDAGVSGSFRLTIPAGVKVWRASNRTELVSGTDYAGAAGDSVGLLVEGLTASGGVRDMTLAARFIPTGCTHDHSDTLKLTVFDVDAQVQGLAEENTAGPHEESPGALLALGQLEPFTPVVAPALTGATLGLTISGSASQVQLWKQAAGGPLVQVNPGETWVLGSPLPSFYLQGAAVGQGASALVTATLTAPSGGKSSADKVAARTVDIDLVLNGVSEADEETVGKLVARNDDRDEFNESPPGTPALDNQLHDPGQGASLVDHINEDDPDLAHAQVVIGGGVAGTWTLSVRYGTDWSDRLKVWRADPTTFNWVLIRPGDVFNTSGSQTIDLRLEGISSSAAVRDLKLDAAFTPTGYATPRDSDSARVAVVGVDLDLDSDNDNGLGAPSRSDAEDAGEDQTLAELMGTDRRPGKIVAVNDADRDADLVPDFADGMNLFANRAEDDAPPTLAQGQQFIPVVLDLPQPIDLSQARMSVAYAGSPPRGIQVSGSGTPASPYTYTPAGGALRLWTQPGEVARDPDPIAPDAQGGRGSYVAPTGSGSYDAADLAYLGFTSTNRTITLYAEAIAPGEDLADHAIEVKVDPDGPGPAGFLASDAVRLTLVNLDLDADSDNNNGFSAPGRTAAEDVLEDRGGDPSRPGKVTAANDDDGDSDGVPDFADGMNLFADQSEDNAPPTAAQGERFAPLRLALPAAVKLDAARIKLAYAASDPNAVQRTGSGTAAAPYAYTPAATGAMRLWKADGNQARNPRSAREASNPGDYLAPTAPPDDPNGADQYYTAAQLGATGTSRVASLFVESLAASGAAGDQRISVWIDPDGSGPAGYLAADGLRLTSTASAFVVDSNGDHAAGISDASTDFVRIGLWDEAYMARTPSGPTDPDQSLIAVRNGTAETDNFVGSDARRFYIRVADATRNLDPATAEQITVDWYTTTATGADDHRPSNPQITLTETGVNTGVFSSRAVMLVSNDLDLTQPTNTGLNAANPVLASAGDPDFRLRLGSIYGNTAFTYNPTAVADGAFTRSVPVFSRRPDERRRLPVRVVNYMTFTDAGYDHDGNPSTPDVGANNGSFDFNDANGNGTWDPGEGAEPRPDLSPHLKLS